MRLLRQSTLNVGGTAIGCCRRTCSLFFQKIVMFDYKVQGSRAATDNAICALFNESQVTDAREASFWTCACVGILFYRTVLSWSLLSVILRRVVALSMPNVNLSQPNYSPHKGKCPCEHERTWFSVGDVLIFFYIRWCESSYCCPWRL